MPQAGAGTDPSAKRDGLRLVVRFAVAFSVLVFLFAAAAHLEGEILGAPVTSSWNELAARLTAIPLSLFAPEVVRHGHFLYYGRHALLIVSDCTGLEVGGLLVAAVLAFPVSWVARIRGVVLGLAVLVALNSFRLVSLAVLKLYSEIAFDVGHLYAWPVVILGTSLIVWIRWAQKARRDEVTRF